MKQTRFELLFWAFLSLGMSSVGIAGFPPEGTIISVFAGQSQQGNHLGVYEQIQFCPSHLLDYSPAINPTAAVSVFLSNRPGATRVFVMGNSGLSKQLNTVWLGQNTPHFHRQLSFADVVSVTPYSNQEVLIATGGGEAAVVDGDGKTLITYNVANFLPTNFPAANIGRLVRVWRPGPDSLAFLTQNHYIHVSPKGTTVIILNSTNPLLPGAFVASFDLTHIQTGIGDDEYVWIAHETFPKSQLSYSLFEIQTGKLIQRHVTPWALGLEEPQPVYFESATGTGYFAVGPELVSMTSGQVAVENPQGQLHLNKLPGPQWGQRYVLVSPPAQGFPFGTTGPWLLPLQSPKAPSGQMVLLNKPPFTNPNVINSQVVPANTPVTTVGDIAPAEVEELPVDEERDILGERRTKKELENYLRQEFASALVGNEISASKLVSSLNSLPRELRLAIFDLPDSFLNPRGLKYMSGTLFADSSAAPSPISDWIDVLWGN